MEKDEAYYTKIILRALGEYEEDLYDGQVSPIKGVDCKTLINDVKEFRAKIISGAFVLVEDTDMQPGDDPEYNELAIVQEEDKAANAIKRKEGQDWLSCGKKALEKETKLIRGVLHSYELLYSNNLSEKRVNEVRELSKKLFNGDIILVETTEKDSYTGEEISAEIGGDIKKIQDKDKAAKDIEWKEYQDWLVCRANFEWKKYQDSLSCEKKTEEPASETVRKSTYSAFWKRLRRMKSRRKSKSIVKVTTETTIEEFETQLTKYANNGYKIKYVNINTKAGNSGTGVRYYAVVQRI